MTVSWHPDRGILADYLASALDDVRASSLEAHLLACGECRDRVASEMPVAPLDAIWSGVMASIDAPRPGIVERTMVAMRVPEHVARLLAATPSLRASWFVAQAIALGFAVAAARNATGVEEDLALFLFLFLAALVPVAGVAVAFGPGVDPTYEIGTAAPIRSDVLLALRTTAVLVTSVLISACAAAAMPAMGILDVAWLLPSLGLTLATLALGTWLRPMVAAVSVGLVWVGVVGLATLATHDRLAVFGAMGQLLCVGAIVVAGIVLARRHTVYEEGIVR